MQQHKECNKTNRLHREPHLAGTGAQPTDQEIRQRAYERYCRRNGASGDALSDWLEAERELLAERGHATVQKR